MIKTPSSLTVGRKQKLWIKILAFVAIAALVYLQPRIEAWLKNRNGEAQRPTATNSRENKADTSTNSANSSDAARPEQASSDGSSDSEASTRAVDESEKTASVDRADSRTQPIELATGNEKSRVETPKTRASDSAVAAEANKTQGQRPSEKSTNSKSAGNASSVVKLDRPSTKTRETGSSQEKNNPPPKANSTDTQTELGVLTEIRRNIYESTAGLLYVPGSADGHRLDHVMKHAADDLDKKIHGVFDGDGDRDLILAVIDEAYLKAKKGGADVRSELQNGRRVYTVNLRRRIGQVGGEEGDRKGNPECRYLRIVLENENEVVSAYPTKSF